LLYLVSGLQNCHQITSDTTIEFAISGYNIAGLHPSESAYDLSHLGKFFDKFPQIPDKGQPRLFLSPIVDDEDVRQDRAE
jgi:hypothetical protein